MASPSSRFNTKRVLDADGRPLGTVIGSELSERTREPTSILVQLREDVRERLGTDREAVWLPCAGIRAIRRGEVTLGRSLEAFELSQRGQEGRFGVAVASDATALAREAAEP